MRAQTGFTLIEMMVTISIAGILAAVAVPSFQNIMTANRLVTQSNDLIADLALARSEAAKTGGRVTVCVSSDGLSCTGGTNWAAGRIVFTDSPTYGTVDGSGATADTILRKSAALSGSNTLASTGFTYVQFLGTGLSNLTGTTNTFTLCHSGFKSQVVRISVTGRAYLDTAASSTC